MRQSVCTLRKAAMVFVAAMSVIFAVFLVWHLVTPTRIGQVTDVGLLAMLALFVLPGATAAVWELERRASSSIERTPIDDEPASPVPARSPLSRIHGTGAASGTTHRRRVQTARSFSRR